jgi:hypothetical protein
MTRNRPTTLRLGVISEATLLPADLIDALLPELERLRLSRAERQTVREIRRDLETDGGDNPDPFDMWQTLCDIADNHTPDFAWFGSHEGDGACIGVWASLDSLEEAIRDGEVLTGPAGEEARAGLVADVSDHGNVTLYSVTRGKRREIWSVV